MRPSTRLLSQPKFEARWPALAIWVFAWGLLWQLDGTFNLGNLALLLVLASAIAGLWLSAFVSIASSALSVLMFNWFFVEPRFTFSVNFHQDLFLLLTMLGVNAVVSYLMVRLRIAAELEAQHANASEQLRELGETLRELIPVEEQGKFIHQFLQQYSECNVSLCVLESDESANLFIGNPDAQDEQGLLACTQQFGALGPGTGRHENQRTVFLPLRGQTRALGAVAFKSDRAQSITQSKREFLQQVCDLFGIEIERAQTMRLAQKAQSDAQNLALRNTLLTSISHDYRTPLANLMGAASVIHAQTDKLDAEKIMDLAQTVLEEAQHLNRMTTNTLQLARLDAGPLNVKKDWESLQELLGSVLATARKRYPTRRFVVDVPSGLPLVQCDAILLVQLCDNLIENAAKYSPEGTPIDIKIVATADELVVRFTDEGPGISNAWKEKVFHAFERVHTQAAQADASEDSQMRRGMGVGLAVCMAIAKVHDAKLWVEDRVPHGASICLSLPVMRQPDVISES
jgi:two-component system sensor histidine kinase KdpD